MSSVNTNYGALIALQNLSKTNSELGEVQNRINTGLKVASAKDNGAVFAIAESLRSDVKGLGVALNTIGTGQAVVDTALAAGERLTTILKDLKTKAIAAKDPTLTTDQRAAYDQDFKALRDEFQKVVDNASFNGINLLKSSATRALSAFVDATGSSSVAQAGSNLNLFGATGAAWTVGQTATIAVTVTTGAVTVGTVTAGFPAGTFTAKDANGATYGTAIAATGTAANLTAVAYIENAAGDQYRLGDLDQNGTIDALIDNKTGKLAYVNQDPDGAGAGTPAWVAASALTVSTLRSTTDVSTALKADSAAAIVEQTLSVVTKELSEIGTFSRSLDGYKTLLTKISDSIESGIGNLVDADLAKESARLQSLQVKQQLGAQALTIANQTPQILLSFFR